jgi:hypothetical protein
MLTPTFIQSLPELAPPVLTVYLDTNQAKQTNRGLKPGYLTRLESGVKSIAQTVSPIHTEAFRQQATRIEEYLRVHPLPYKGIAIFAGRDAWEVVPLQIEVQDEIRWGAPAVAQLYWLLDEHKPYGLVTVDQKRARFFLYWLDELLELEEREFRLEVSKEKEMGPVARAGGVRVSRGTNRDVYEHHVDAQYAHFYRQIAERVERWCAAEHLQSVFLAGLSEMAKGIWKELPQALQGKAIPIEENLGWMSRAEVVERFRPIAVKHEREREVALIGELLGAGRGVVLGIDETLAQLQKGTIRTVVIAKGLKATLLRCGECLWVDRASDPRCPACGRERYEVALREVLPELARRYNISLEVVSGEAARKLQEAGGMGAWLSELGRKEYGQRLTFA